MRTGPITLESLQAVARRCVQFIECGDRIDLDQLSYRYPGDRIPSAAHSGLEEHPGLFFREALDQSILIL
jgi:hypothetical protein